ncbi:MAG: STAS domain-containing protein [Gammaproteobacteria bacterium]|nr:STAS domain-containing protein [Gammaproteobacteria bacterium]
MSEFELKDYGDGRFSLTGNMTFETAERILAESEKPFERYTQIQVDLSNVTDADSAGLALLLEWITWANHTVREIRFLGMPDRVLAIAQTTEVDHLLKRGERWSGFIEAPEEQPA